MFKKKKRKKEKKNTSVKLYLVAIIFFKTVNQNPPSKKIPLYSIRQSKILQKSPGWLTSAWDSSASLTIHRLWIKTPLCGFTFPVQVTHEDRCIQGCSAPEQQYIIVLKSVTSPAFWQFSEGVWIWDITKWVTIFLSQILTPSG